MFAVVPQKEIHLHKFKITIYDEHNTKLNKKIPFMF